MSWNAFEHIVAIIDAAGPPVAPDPSAHKPDKKSGAKSKAKGGGKGRGGDRGGYAPPRERPAWYYDCLFDSRNEPLGNLANALLPLRRDKAISELFAYDQLYCGVMLTGALPGAPPDSGPYPRPVTDVDVGRAQEYIQLAGLAKLGKDVSHQAVDQRASECAFHPVRDYLNPLEWDGKPRLKNWLTTYFGVEDSPYAQRVGVMFMVSLIARVFKPGCKVDHMLVLEGPQGELKSTACRVLGGPWFSDQLPDIAHGGKDVSQHLRGKWLIEIAEMQAMDKAASAALKAFITRDTERYRPSFGRKETVEPRQCVFIGTTNENAYLRDATGARRYWPVKIGVIDIEALMRDRDQLFAEALREFRAGTAWWPDREFEREHARPQQEARYEIDVWEEKIAVYLAERRHTAKANEDTIARVTVGDVLRDCLGFEEPKIGTTEQRRTAAALLRLGWERERADGKTDKNGKRWWICKADRLVDTVAI
jgi:Virulence-associated protein E-like domain